MNVAELVEYARSREVELHLQGESLRFRGALGSLDARVRRDLVQRKGEILAFLKKGEGSPWPETLAPLGEATIIGGLELRNRLVMSPMEVDMGEGDGTVGDRVVNYYAARARGGVGLVVVEATCVESPRGRLSPNQLLVDRDEAIAGLRRLAEAVQGEGARVALQLQHAGRKTSAMLTGEKPVAPSPVANHLGETPRELTVEDIAALVERFAEAAARAQIAGFDAVEIHAAHGYLQAQFLSPTYNQRQDGYGGSPENRRRFLLETVAAVRRRCGHHFPVLCRLSAVELEAQGEVKPLAGGLQLKETLALAVELEAAGVAAIDLSATLVGTSKVHPMAWPEGALAEYCKALKEVVSLPVSMTSRVPPKLAADMMRAGSLDLVRLGRPLLADADLPRRLAAGEQEELRPCIYCSECLDPQRRQPAVVCAVNPTLGQEGAAPSLASSKPRKVVVVGGGPAGMEAAITASRRGHEVVLVERGAELGGQLLVPSKPREARKTYGELLTYLRGEVQRAPIEVLLETAATASLVTEELGAEAILLATGSRLGPSRLAGAHWGVAATDVLMEGIEGSSLAVVGAGLVGCETALALATEGRSVTLFERGQELAPAVPVDIKAWLRWAVEAAAIELHFGAEVTALEEGVNLRFRHRAGEGTERYDGVVLATGAEPVLEGWNGLEFIRVGDCKEPRDLRHAIHEGRAAGESL